MGLVVDRERALAAATAHHFDYVSRHPDVLLAEPVAVGTLAANLARAYYAGGDNSDSGTQVSVCRAAGYLVYGPERYGMGFDEVRDAAGMTVSDIVCGGAPDIRLKPGKQRDAHKLSLAEAGPAAQLTRLAELVHKAQKYADLPRAALVARGQEIGDWVEAALCLTDVMHALRKHRIVGPLLVEAEKRFEALPMQVEDARRVLRERRRAAAPCHDDEDDDAAVDAAFAVNAIDRTLPDPGPEPAADVPAGDEDEGDVTATAI
jgi:hypothetical protein